MLFSAPAARRAPIRTVVSTSKRSPAALSLPITVPSALHKCESALAHAGHESLRGMDASTREIRIAAIERPTELTIDLPTIAVVHLSGTRRSQLTTMRSHAAQENAFSARQPFFRRSH